MRIQNLTLAVVVGISSLLACAPSVPATVITYLSSERFVQATTRIDAVGFTDFHQSVESFDIIFGTPRNIERASQFSQLLSDRIIAQCSAETAAQVGSGANSAVSRSVVMFSISEQSPYRLDTGPVFLTTSGGGAQVSLRNVDTGLTIEFINSSPTPPRTGLLLPGTYQFIVTASADSLQFTQGPSAAFGAIVLPTPSVAIVILGGGLIAHGRRSRCSKPRCRVILEGQ